MRSCARQLRIDAVAQILRCQIERHVQAGLSNEEEPVTTTSATTEMLWLEITGRCQLSCIH